jgi:hypothetical protein
MTIRRVKNQGDRSEAINEDQNSLDTFQITSVAILYSVFIQLSFECQEEKE